MWRMNVQRRIGASSGKPIPGRSSHGGVYSCGYLIVEKIADARFRAGRASAEPSVVSQKYAEEVRDANRSAAFLTSGALKPISANLRLLGGGYAPSLNTTSRVTVGSQ